MQHVDTTLSEPLAQALNAYLNDQAVQLTPAAIVQVALEEFLSQRGYLPSFQKRLRITPASESSGYTDTSLNHDKVLASENSVEHKQ